MRDLIIIGGGPVGLSAAAYALSKQLDVALICSKIGGQAGKRQQLAGQAEPERIEGESALEGFRAQVGDHPDRILQELVIGIVKRGEVFQVLTENQTLYARAVLLATGANAAPLGIPREPELVGHGLGYSITTHAHLAAGREVAVVGSTARALRGVAELVSIAARVVLIVPQPGELNSPLARPLRAHPKVHMLEGYQIAEVETAGGSVNAILVTRGDGVQRLPVQALFVAQGLVPNSQLVRQLARLDADGFVLVDEDNRTSLPGLFAAGDVTSMVAEQIVIALGEGARAAVSAYDYILAQRMGVEGELVRG